MPNAATRPFLGKRVLLVDPCAMTRECLASLLVAHRFDVEAAGHAPESVSGGLLLLHIAARRVDDPNVQRRITALRDRCGVGAALAVISERPDFELALAAVRIGAHGYLPTSLSAEMAVAAVELILAGGIFVPAPSVLDAGSVTPPKPALDRRREAITSRESEVLTALREGQPNKIIAHGLQISEHTVKVHVRNIMKKLRVTNRTQLAIVARRMSAKADEQMSF
ncbi:MAG: response regulator transcription factor [Acetobacteraceae bacterium]|nr:response regulator transcription factor [Acetobacteraceae bacterium]